MNNGLIPFLQTPASQEKQMEDAVLHNDIESINDLIHNGFNVNRKLHFHGGNSALHLATKQGYANIIEVLLQLGANPLAKNDFNITPISTAIKKNDSECLETLINYAERLLDLGTLWLQFDGSISLWKDSNDQILQTLIRCTPNIRALRSNVQSNLLYLLRNGQMYDSLKAFVLVGNNLTAEEQSKLDPVRDKEFLDWMKTYKCTVHPLKHYCRLSVRQSFQGHYNVFYGSRRLPVPTSIQDYICLRDTVLKDTQAESTDL